MNEESELEEFAPWFVLVITLVGGFLRVLLLGAKGMWLDETFSVWLANMAAGDMLHWIIQIDQHPPLYYLLLHSWVALAGDTPFYARLLSALFGTATIPFIYLTGRRIGGPTVGVTAAVLLAVSPLNIYFAQEARMYALLTFTVAVAIYALARLLTDARAVEPIGSQFRQWLHTWRTAGPVEPEPNADPRFHVEPPRTGWRGWVYRHRWSPIQSIETDLAWVGFIVFSAATLLTHNTAVFFPLATNLFVIGLMVVQRARLPAIDAAMRAPSLANWVKAQAAILLLWLPWLPVFVMQARRVDEQFWLPQPTWEIVTETLRALLNSSAPTIYSQAMMWVLCGVLLLGMVYFRKRPSILFFLATLFLVPVLGELIVSIRRPIFYYRTLIWITLPLLLLLAAGVAQVRYRFVKIGVVGLLVTTYLFAAGDYFRFAQKEDWSTPAGYVANFAEAGDLLLFNSNFVVIPFDYYFAPYAELYSIEVEKQGVPLDLYRDGVLEPQMTESDIPALSAMLRGHDRVWLVYSHDSYTDPQGLIPQTLAAQMNLTRTRDFYGGQVQLYETP